MTIKWTPSGPACPRCGGPKEREVNCGSCDYEIGDPLWFGKDESPLPRQMRERADILMGIGLNSVIPRKIKSLIERGKI